ncbi:hypothetical protein [Chelativorans alearense]|uniref:hypothetical protein n=1 Tax=Chelativorans alearense TaxID=2681495 RepID=UPI0013D38472|nr:hypothetical protein [Chelativorans alearense]
MARTTCVYTECETFLLCDKVGTASTPFIRRICRDADGTIQPPEDTDLDGAAYQVQGTVGSCENGTDLEMKVMCDDGTVSFLRWYVSQDGQPTGQFFDTDLDGVAYTPSDPAAVSVGPCPQDPECAPTPTTQLLYDIRSDGTVVPFLRHMVVDCEGNVLETHDTGLDEQDYVVDPNGEVVAQPPGAPKCEALLLCDKVGTASTPFIRRICRDADGTIQPPEDTDLDGAAYLIQGEVGSCENGTDLEMKVMCDGGTVSFLRWYVSQDGQPTGQFFDTDLDGVAYVPTAAVSVGPCPQDPECAPTPTTQLLYDIRADGTVVPFLRHMVVDCEGNVLETHDTGLDGQDYVVDPNGEVAAQAPGAPKCEALLLCDKVGTASTPFIRRICRDADGTIQPPEDTDLDGAAYQVQGAVGSCENGTDLEMKVMCDGGTVSFLRWYVSQDGQPTGQFFDTDLDGVAYAPTAAVSVGPCPQDAECAPTPTTQLLYDIRADGTVVPFLRHMVVDCEGNVIETHDTGLDGQDYIVDPNGEVVAQPPAEEPCAATVHAREMCDLRPDVEPNEEGQRCAVRFFRNYVYDCEGNFVRHYDTDAEGQPYQPVAGADCPNGLTPSLVELEWPQTNVIADPAGQEGHDYIYTVTNPRTGEEAQIKLNTVTAASTTPGGECEAWQPGNNVVVNAPIGHGEPESRFTFTLDEVAQRMTSLRLDFVDLDHWEGVRSLDPVPDRVDFSDGEGVWVPGTGDIDAIGENVTAHAYYDNPPATITHLYRNAGGGFACHAAAFQGITYASGPACNCIECENCEPTATTQLLYDIRADGTVVPFRRDTVVDCEGNILSSNDTTLDGQDYVVDPNGQVVPQPPACASTVHAREMRDLRPDVEPNEEGQRCAVPFFRNYVYDCEGNFVRHYDTDAEGQPYTPIAVADTTDGIPSLVELEWPQTNVIADPDGQEGHDYIYTVTNPRTGEEARIKFNTVTAPGGSTPCGANWQPGQNVSVNAPLGHANPESRFTFTLDEVAQRMTSLRLDFIDIDPWEGVRSLDPVPDRVEFIDGEGVWVPGTGDIDALVQNITARAYYDNPPATITHLYRNAGGGVACHAAAFQGLTYASGPYCNCGCSGGGGGSDCVTATTQVLCDVQPATAVTPYTFDFTESDAGITSTPVTEATAPNGVVYSINQGIWFDTETSAFILGSGKDPEHLWTFHNGPVDLEFDVRGMHVSNNAKYLQFPEGTEAMQVTQPYFYWDPVTYRLYRRSGGATNIHYPNRFRLRNVTSLAFTAGDQTTLSQWGMMSLTMTPVVDTPAPVQFMRHTSTDCGGNVLAVTDWTLDGSSEYQPQGQVQLCSDCVTTTQVLCDVLPTPAVAPYTFDFATNNEGITSTPVTEATAENGVVYSINQGIWFGPATVTPGLFLLGDETNHHVWHFHNGPVDLEFDIREIEFGVDPKYLQFQVDVEMLEVTQPLVFWDATTHRLHRQPGSGADIKRSNRFRLRNTLSLDLSPSPGTTLNGWAMVGLTVTPAVITPDPVQFLRHTTLDCGGNVLSTADVWLDGAPYHPRGQVQFCD